MRAIGAIILIFLLLGGCAAADDGSRQASGSEERIEFIGRIVYVPLEGGFYGIVSDAGKKYDPVSLPEQYRRDGLRVRIQARVLPHSVGLHMWGTKIEIIAVERL